MADQATVRPHPDRRARPYVARIAAELGADMEAGALGLIFGRNLWQGEHDGSLRFVARLRELLEK
jgi:DhnA family fructose-bisphosphate aldolase class Ia